MSARRAILHLGFHKTGTTFLQLSTRRWIESRLSHGAEIFFSCQHASDCGWRRARTEGAFRLRNRLARTSEGAVPSRHVDVLKSIGDLGLAADFEQLCRHFDRNEGILIHSDENCLGTIFGHCTRAQEPSPFYPNGAWICAAFAAAAYANYNDIHVVLTLRRFDEMFVSMLKDAARGPRLVPPLHLYHRALEDMASRCRAIITQTARLDFISKLHIMDHQLLSRAPLEYCSNLWQLSGADWVNARIPRRPLNVSPGDSQTLDSFAAKGVISPAGRKQFDDVASLVGKDFLNRLAGEFQLLRHELHASAEEGGRIRYYD